MNQSRTSDAGVTLIEVLVSLAIFAIIGVAGLTVLDTVARTGERTEGRLERLADIDRAFLVMRRDLAQLEGGETRLDDAVLQFRRSSSDGGVSVAYRFEGTTLYRDVSAAGPIPVAQTILTGVADAQWRLLNGANQWVATWPPDGGPMSTPRAAELTLDVTRADNSAAQTVTRVFLLPAGHTQ